MSKLSRFRILKVGSVAVPVRNLELNPLKLEFLDDENFTGYFDAKAGRAASRWMEIGFEAELKGRGAAEVVTDALYIEALLEAAGFVADSPGSNRRYLLDHLSNETKVPISTLECFYGDTLSESQINYVGRQVVFDATLVAEAGQIAYIEFNGMGQFGSNPANAAAPAALATYGDDLRAIAGSLTFTIDGVAKTLSLRSLRIQLGNEITLPGLITSAYGKGAPEIVNRNTTVECVVIEPEVSSVDFWEAVQESGNASVQREGLVCVATLVLGNIPKNILTIYAPFRMIGIPERSDIDGICYYTIRGKYERWTGQLFMTAT